MSLPAVLAVLYGPPPAGTRNVGAVIVYRVLQAIADDADDDARGYFPARSLDALARDLELVKRDVQNAVRALVDQGRIVKVQDAVPRVSGTVYDLVVDRPLVRGFRPYSYGDPAQSAGGTRTGDPHELVGNSYGDPPVHPFYPSTPPVVPPAVVEEADPEPERIDREAIAAILEANGAARRLIHREPKPPPARGAVVDPRTAHLPPDVEGMVRIIGGRRVVDNPAL